MAFLRTRNGRDYAVTTPNGIDEAKYVKIGGLERQVEAYIRIKGRKS